MMKTTTVLTRAAVALPVLVTSPSSYAQTAATTDGATTKTGVLIGLGEMSPWSMFLDADWVVKAVMIGLCLPRW